MRGVGTIFILGLAGLTGWLFASLTAPGQEWLGASVTRIEALHAEAEALGARIRAIERSEATDAPTPAMARLAATASGAALDLQHGVVELARQNGLELSTFGAQPAPEGLTLRAVSVVLEGEGETADMARFLAALEAERPPIAVAQLTLRDQSRRRVEGGEAPVAFRIAAWSFWTEGDS